jgi:membrane-associated PAP2 superfamily phosphatase
MFETGLWGVEGKPVELGKWSRRSLSKDEGKVFSASKASSALAISCLCWVFGDFCPRSCGA